MSRKGLQGQRRGSIMVQLGATAGVLVLPPLMLSAGVTLFGSQTEDRLQIAADQTVASAVSKYSALVPPRPREVAKSAERPPLHDEPAVVASQPTPVTAASTAAATTEPAVEPDASPSKETEAETATEPPPFLGPIPVTLVVVRREPEPDPEPGPAEPEEEPAPTPPSSPVASIESVVPHTMPKSPAAHVSHLRVKADREEARASHRIAEKRPHAAAPHAPAASTRATAGAHRVAGSAAPKAKPKSGLQRRADLEN